MVTGIIGRKIGMTQLFAEDGSVVPATVIKEAAFILILLYPIESVKDSNRSIERIRRCYLRQFDQESVLRVDDPFASWVSF